MQILIQWCTEYKNVQSSKSVGTIILLYYSIVRMQLRVNLQ